ncbi:YlmC/YmxH family sporulation protein [Tissierella carlieri]|uniref:YlmC/YmxH family sporulation protein n=1 Tax=Tissierella carlieri TaxID=689904 RepID=A0ABT1S5J9_9FIRM|nr:YlmC/YmxH family sporulation protein [Tissierella carlieri]MBU5314279.1 YlmC/YmxH family sporulation protein [Tissierella carlieri]MCQ4921741.1 YlmC/YmxH family sporulation protein [Tissierella carlieri]
MRLLELGQKEIVNLNNGGRLGLIADSDFLIDEETGKIISLLVPEKRLGFRILGLESNGTEIPWNAIRKIGYDMIIIELD